MRLLKRFFTDPLLSQIKDLRPHFDAEFYLAHNPDVRKSGIDPVDHYCRWGWREGRDPTPYFSTRYYLAVNKDVATAGLNPFWHYLVAGKTEGRSAEHPGGYRARLLLQARPLEEVAAASRMRTPPEMLLSADMIRTQIRRATRGETTRLIVSISHDDYSTNSGGVQYCIQHEADTAAARGMLYLNIHPYHPLPRLAHEDEDPDVLVSLVCGRAFIGTAPMSALIKAIQAMAASFAKIDVVIHHLMGNSPEQIVDLVRATGCGHCWLWIHDFFTLCPSYALQRNNVSFCNAPPPTSNACALCLYGAERVAHRARIHSLFGALSIHVIAPSNFAAGFWSTRSDVTPASLMACEHMTVRWEKRPRKAIEADGPIAVAFAGYPAPHKGWPVFERLVLEKRCSSSRFRFVYFGTSTIALPGVERVEVRVTADDPDAMIRAMAEQRIDIVLHWASCAETFSFTTHEAIAAGAFVLTNSLSGNVALTVAHLGQGAMLEDEADLTAFFRDGRAEAMAAASRARRQIYEAVIARSDMSLAFVD